MAAGGAFQKALEKFAEDVTAKLSANAPGQPEDQLRGPFETLLVAAGSEVAKTVLAKGEALLAGRIGKPDYAVLVDAALTGYAELKATGAGADPARFTGHDRKQAKRFTALPNLLYCDGNEWALYRDGDRQGSVVRLAGDVASGGKAAIGAGDADKVLQVLTDFFSWTPIVPTSPAQLAEVLAPLCRLLNQQVAESLTDPKSPLVQLAKDWRALLFPDAPDDQFADAYAQTVTYALLLAQADGAKSLDAATAAATLGTKHGLLARALQVLTDPAVDAEIGSSLRLLERTIGAVSTTTLGGSAPDPWLYFYETFLAAYDPDLRRNAGVYYTPVEVVQAQVRIADDLLRTKLNRPLGFADPKVETLDPAVGTGTYLLAVIAFALAQIGATQGAGAVPGEATSLAARLFGFELLAGPYSVAQLRVTREIQAQGGTLPTAGPGVFLTDTLEDPATVPTASALFYEPIAAEHKRAQQVKDKTPILVCLGNPPYDRHDARDPVGGWIRAGATGVPAPLEDFIGPARASGASVHLKNLYNLYVYFWRWALWKVFEHTSAPGPGIVSFISASSYLAGPAFVGMREKMRRECDEIWIIDLGGDNRGARKEENVFDIQLPVAIGIGIRVNQGDTTKPATVHYSRVGGSRSDKFKVLNATQGVDDLAWETCPTGWLDPFRPAGVGSYFSWPPLTDLMPWQTNGVQVKRTWPIAPDDDTLKRRWQKLVKSSKSDRADLYRETRDRSVDGSYKSTAPGIGGGGPIAKESAGAQVPSSVAYGYRSLDTQRLLADYRLIDLPRPDLWRSHSDDQVYLTTMQSATPGDGPAVMATGAIPDLHHFRGSFGGKDVFPLWRDSEAKEANLQPGLLEAWGKVLGRSVSDQDAVAYIYAITCSPAFTAMFEAELEVMPLRIPLTADDALFGRAVDAGKELLFLHTYGERFATGQKMPHGSARATHAVPSSGSYPSEVFYDETAKELRVGQGVFAPVEPEVVNYEVSGFQVVRNWLDRRLAEPGGRRSSDLDDISPSSWETQFTTGLLNLLWILERTIELHDEQKDLLDEIVAAPVFDAQGEVPSPPDWSRGLPKDGTKSSQDALFPGS